MHRKMGAFSIHFVTFTSTLVYSIVWNQFPVRTRPTSHIFQTRQKRRVQNGRCTTHHNKGRHRFFQMKTTRMCYICRVEDPDDEHWHCNAKLGREFFSSMLITPIKDKKTTVNDGDICYRILPYLTRCNFFNISLHG